MNVTLAQIRSHRPCCDGWSKLLSYLGKTATDDEPLSLGVVLQSNGIADALWCLRVLEGRGKEIRLFAVFCARQVQHLLTDPRSFAAIDTAERFANEQATRDELDAARAAAYAAYAAYAPNATAAYAATAAADAYAAYAAYAAGAAYAAADAYAADAYADAAYTAYAAGAAYAAARDVQAAEFMRVFG